ncbi:MAG: Ig-like domain-containing protein [Acidimicrobiales bacterium]
MLVGTAVQPTPTAAAPALNPADIVDEYVAGGSWTGSVSADFLPDGRLLTITTAGNVYLVNPVTAASTQLFTLPGVLSSGESGLLDIAVDPDFATNSYFYTYSSELSSRRLRVDRFTLAGTGTATLASRTLIWINPGPSMGVDNYHIGGSLNFGPDGMLYLSTGDNLVGGNSQLLTTVFGKVLRFAPDGTLPTDNPFFDGSGPNIDEIYALGIRNGFRSSFDRATGEYWMGDVGGNNAATAYEEVDLIQAGANYGWPVCEGPLGQPKNGASCPTGITGPLHTYSHDVAGGCCQNRSITGGEVYRGSAFPASFVGTYVYADYATRTFFWLERNGGTVTSGELRQPALAGGTPVWIGVSPVDGAIYWMHYGFGSGQLRRLRYTGTVTHPPTVTQATATPTSGPAPLSVAFAASATDLDGDAVTYRWDFGDGTSATSANPTKIYAGAGVYTAQLTVTANGDSTTGAPITIQVGQPPTAAITAPTTTTFRAGDTIVVEGSATDPDDGPLPASALAWTIVFRHDDHTHPVATGTGSSISLPVPNSSGHSWEGATGYRVTLTATDSDGLTDTEVLDLDPVKTAVDITADAPVNITIDGITEPVPSVLDTAVGAQHVISAPAEACVAGVLRTFAGWSSGAPRTHTLTAVENHPALSATYTSGGPCGPQLYRAVNINGRALVIDGVAFEDGLSAPNFSSGPTGFCDQSVPLVPPPGATETEMIRCSTYGFGNAVTTMTNVPNGSYTVEYWVWEDNNSETFTPSINGVAQPTIISGGTGAWQKVGPVPVVVTANRIQLSATGGASNFSGIRVWQATPEADTSPPSVVSVTPAGGASGVATGTTVTVNFTEPVNANGGVTLAAVGGSAVATTATASGSAVTLVPAGPLSPGTTYRVTVSTAVRDLAGNPLASAATSTFSTASTPPADVTAPTVVSVLPAGGASGAPTSSTVSVTFSEPVAPNGGISLAVDGGAVVPTTATVSGNTVTLTPSGPLGAATTYRLNVTTAVRDLAGNPLAAGSVTTFSTGAAPANTELKVSRAATRTPAVPLAGSTWAPGEPVYVFLDVATPAAGVRFHLDTPVTGTPAHLESLSPWDFNGGGSIEAFPYVNGLTEGSHTITAVLTRADGGTDIYSATFTVGTTPPPPDTTPPVVNGVSPANGATGVPTTATPAVTFSEPVTANGGVTLAVDGGAAVAATATVSGNTVTLTPSALLATGTTYRVTVSGAVRDLAGNPLATTSATTFSTAAAPPPPDTTPPTVQSVTPAPGAAAVATGTTVAVRFSEAVAANGGVTLAVDGGAAVTTAVSGSGDTVILTPTTPLTPGTTYRVTVSGAVRDLAGNPLATTSATTFTTAAAPPPPPGGSELKVSRAASRAPAVPLAGNTWAPGERVYVFLDVADPAVGVRFFLDGPVTGSPIRIEGAAPWDFGGGGSTTAFPYTNALANGSHTINALLTRPDGTTATYSAAFTVAATPPPPDTTAPTVVTVNPAAGATSVAPGTTVTITFSEPVLPNGGVTLAVDGGATVPATIATSGNSLILTPSQPLAPATTYRLVASGAVQDLVGNPLATPSSTTFTTAAAAPPIDASLQVSRSATRSPAVPLAGNVWTVGEQVYVFLDVTTPAVNVRFFLDTPITGTPFRIENLAPWDFGGGATLTANPYTAGLGAGTHTISALLTRTDGTTIAYSATFTVA